MSHFKVFDYISCPEILVYLKSPRRVLKHAVLIDSGADVNFIYT